MKQLWNQGLGPVYDQWETLSADERSLHGKAQLKTYIEFAKNQSPYWKSALRNWKWNEDSPLDGVPPLSSSQLRKALDLPQGEGLFTRSDQAFSVFQSGGTTGRPKSSYFTHEELEGLNLPNARGFYACGLSPDDRVANLWAVGGLYMTFVHINRMIQQYGCMSFPFSNNTPSEFVHGVAEQYDINTFTGITSVVLTQLREMLKMDKKRLKVKKIFFGGEHIYDSDRLEMKEEYGVEVIAAPGYGSVDSWYIGYQCLGCPPGVFHSHDDQVYIELLNPETLKPVQGDEVGLMHVTAYPRRLTPVIRYAVGDRARWLTDDCSCGRKSPRFELLGRGDDVLRIGYDSVDYAFVQGAVTKDAALTGNVRMSKSRLEGKDKLSIHVESREALSQQDSKRAAEALRERILSARPTLAGFISKGQVHPLDVEIKTPGSLPRNERTGKLVRVVDVL